MQLNELKEIIEKNYNIKIMNIEKVKNTYKIQSDEKAYCIKIIKYDFPHFYFILSAIKHLQKNGFETIPEILKSKDKKDYISIDNKFAYLTEWIPSRISNYDNPVELRDISIKLGELHKCSENFNITREMKPRYGWYSWIKTFDTRCDEILDFQKRINQKAYKTDFDKIFLENIESEVKRGQEAINGLIKNNYKDVMSKEIMKCGFCHHDYAHHNILVDENGELIIIDFDYCILDSHIHDLSSLIIRTMKGGKWNNKKADLIIDGYCSSNYLNKEELPLMKNFIKFPQSFWQIGLQYYWEQQPWGEEFFINKIIKYLDDRDDREEFLEEYFNDLEV